MNTHITQHLHLISTHPQWKFLSWETRGMALELMGAAGSDEFFGTLPAEDELWRNILNIPSQRSIQSALKNTVNGRGLREQNELDIAWHEVWKPQLLRWFTVITPAFVVEHPQYHSCLGRYFHPLLDLSPGQPLNVRDKPASKHPPKSHLRTETKLIQKKRRPAPPTAIDAQWDYPLIRYSPNTFKSCWEEPLPHEARATLWDSALKILAPSGDAVSARQFIGKLIKEFGEKTTATAVSQLVIRAVPPADPKSFLRKQVKNLSEGSPKQQQANRMHVQVPL